MTAVVVIEGMVIALLVILVTGLLRSHAEILRQLHLLNGGSAALPRSPLSGGVGQVGLIRGANDLVGETPSGEAAAVAIVGATDSILLSFLSTNCLTCASFWERFRHPESLDLPPGTRLVVVTKDVDEESLARVTQLSPPHLTVIMSTEAWVSYEVPGSPYFVLVDGPSGQVAGEGTAGQWDQVLSLIGQATADANALRGRARDAHRPADDAARIDAELRAAGIQPGHPSLYGEVAPRREAG